MPIPVTIPRLGWNMEEGTFVEWLKVDGDAVKPGDVLYKLEGEKSVEEIESLDGGVLHIPSNAPKAGERVNVGDVIAQLLQPGESPAASGPTVRKITTEVRVNVNASVDLERSLEVGRTGSNAITPRARRLATRHGIDTTTVTGTGRNGRVRERDVAVVLQFSATPNSMIVPHSPIRRAIAARMVESHRTTVPVTLTSNVDASNLVSLRKQFQLAGDGGPMPTITDLFVKLAGFAILKNPIMASRWSDAGLIPPASIDIGIAVDTDAGLLVPVVSDVPALGLLRLAVKTRDLIERARSGKLTAREMSGGCFTITNLGGFGIDEFTPIINPPESAILGIGRIERRPVMDGDRVVGREQVTLSLTFDHRVMDGALAARFLQTLAGMIVNPGVWLTN